MKIIILGSGKVGLALLDAFTAYDYDITMIDQDKKALANVSTKYDVKAILGNGCSQQILKEAGADEANIFIASTPSDETNIVACHNVNVFFNIETKIARISSNHYIEHQNELFFDNKHHPFIDAIFSPELIIADHISNIINFHNCIQVKDFANHRMTFVHVRLNIESPIIKPYGELLQEFRSLSANLIAVFRDSELAENFSNLVAMEDDELLFLVDKNKLHKLMNFISGKQCKTKNILVAGGGMIGRRTAKKLAKNYNVKIIEESPSICQDLSVYFNNTNVSIINGNATDFRILQEANLERTDCVCSLTNSDELNFILAMMSKDFNISNSIALINNNISYYRSVLDKYDLIDTIFSPKHIIGSHMLSYLVQGKIIRAESINQDKSFLIEAIVNDKSSINGLSVSELPGIFVDIIVGAVIRNDNVITSIEGDFKLEVNDYLLILILDSKKTLLENLIEYF